MSGGLSSARRSERPLAWEGARLTASGLLRGGRPEAARRFLRPLFRIARPPASLHLLMAEACRRLGEEEEGFRWLTRAQRHFPQDARVLAKLADLRRKDARPLEALACLQALKAAHPAAGALKIMAFAAVLGWEEDLAAALTEVEALSDAEILAEIGQIDRASGRFAALAPRFGALRARAYRRLSEVGGVEKALAGRWLEAAEGFARSGASREARARLELLRDRLGPLAGVLRLAHLNEDAEPLTAVHQGAPLPLEAAEAAGLIPVEFFIPRAFFADSREEKPPYEAIRRFFRLLAEDLAARPEVCLVFRHQFGWRHALRRTSGRGIGYHTSGAPDPLWRHVQESTLAGRCSADRAGFAGFSSIASDFSAIEAAAVGVAPARIEANFQEMRREFVEGRRSKYPQKGPDFTPEGPYVFVPLQVQTDVVAALGHVSGLEHLRGVVAAHRGSGLRVVVKRHPYCESLSLWRALRELSASGEILLTEAPIHGLIAGCEAVHTVNSGVGLEALLHLKPVWTAGACDYAAAAAGVFRSFAEIAAHRPAPPGAGLAPEQEARIKRFLWFYNRFYALPADERGAAALVADLLEAPRQRP